MQQANVLLVEDERDISDLITLQLEKNNFNVTSFDNGANALDYIQDSSNQCEKNFDLFILDRMLPEVNGIEICRFIRLYKKTKSHPILFLTAMGENDHIIEGLEAGADDYVAKPFNPEVLVARINSLLRRSLNQKTQNSEDEEEIIKHLDIEINQKSCSASQNGQTLPLTKSEYLLLTIFVKKPGKVYTRQQLVDMIQDEPVHVTSRTIDTHIFGLRKKLGENSKLIETVRGIGYRIGL